MKPTTLKSWLGVYKQPATAFVADTVLELEDLLNRYPTAKVIGKQHSYNRLAFADVVIELGKAFHGLEWDGDDILAGAACSVEDVMKFAMSNERVLINSGNYRQQTLGGVYASGTHGYGKQATMADSMEPVKTAGEFVTQFRIQTKEAESYKMTNCVCRLSELSEQSEHARIYFVFPYSGDADLVAFVAESEVTKPTNIPKTTIPRKSSWRKLTIAWRVDSMFPFIRKFVQGRMKFIKLPKWQIITSVDDYDSKYHPFPGVDATHKQGKPGFFAWLLRPTYQADNLAVFAKPEDTESLIRHAIKFAEMIKLDFKCFIGVRELTTKSETPWAGNFDGPRNAVDFYFRKKDYKKKEILQKNLQATFDLVPHLAKSI